MYRDVVDLHDFYRDRLGRVVQRLMRRRLRQMWPDVSGQRVMGFGYAGHLLQAFDEQPTTQRFLVMPAAQGVMHFLLGRECATCSLRHGTRWTLATLSAGDRVMIMTASSCTSTRSWRKMSGC